MGFWYGQIRRVSATVVLPVYFSYFSANAVCFLILREPLNRDPCLLTLRPLHSALSIQLTSWRYSAEVRLRSSESLRCDLMLFGISGTKFASSHGWRQPPISSIQRLDLAERLFSFPSTSSSTTVRVFFFGLQQPLGYTSLHEVNSLLCEGSVLLENCGCQQFFLPLGFLSHPRRVRVR